jgi:hypothetical protein
MVNFRSLHTEGRFLWWWVTDLLRGSWSQTPCPFSAMHRYQIYGLHGKPSPLWWRNWMSYIRNGLDCTTPCTSSVLSALREGRPIHTLSQVSGERAASPVVHFKLHFWRHLLLMRQRVYLTLTGFPGKLFKGKYRDIWGQAQGSKYLSNTKYICVWHVKYMRLVSSSPHRKTQTSKIKTSPISLSFFSIQPHFVQGDFRWLNRSWDVCDIGHLLIFAVMHIDRCGMEASELCRWSCSFV